MQKGQSADLSRNLYSPAMRYFLATVEAGSIRSAAKNLNVASSAINRQILWLEEALGLQLFDRVGRRLRLSQAGEILLAHVRRTYSDFDGTVAELEALKGLRRGSVSIACVESVAERLLPEVIAGFRKSYPGVHVNVAIASSAEAAKLVENAEADVGFTFDPPERATLTTAFQHDLVIGALMAPEHPLSAVDGLRLSDCMAYPIVLPAKGSSIRARIEAVFSETNKGPGTFIEANSLRLMRTLAARGNEIGFQTPIGCEDDVESGKLIYRPLADGALQADRLCMVTSSLRALALAPQMFFDHSVAALKVQIAKIDAKKAS